MPPSLPAKHAAAGAGLRLTTETTSAVQPASGRAAWEAEAFAAVPVSLGSQGPCLQRTGLARAPSRAGNEGVTGRGKACASVLPGALWVVVSLPRVQSHWPRGAASDVRLQEWGAL